MMDEYLTDKQELINSLGSNEVSGLSEEKNMIIELGMVSIP